MSWLNVVQHQTVNCCKHNIDFKKLEKIMLTELQGCAPTAANTAAASVRLVELSCVMFLLLIALARLIGWSCVLFLLLVCLIPFLTFSVMLFLFKFFKNIFIFFFFYSLNFRFFKDRTD